MENWYDSMPRIKRAGKYDFRSSTNGGGVRIDSHFKSSHCVVCGLESSTGESTISRPLVVYPFPFHAITTEATCRPPMLLVTPRLSPR